MRLGGLHGMSATLLRTMGSDLDVANAARVSFGKAHAEFADSDARLVNYLAKHGHWTPFAHCMASFHMKAPVAIARQLFKHKVGLVENEISRRYVDTPPEFFLPSVWRKRAEDKKQGSSDEEVRYVDFEGEFQKISDTVAAYYLSIGALYDRLIKAGVCPEQARFVLPGGAMTEWVWTGSLAAWSRICFLRLQDDAQIETAELVLEIDGALSSAFPVVWEALAKARAT